MCTPLVTCIMPTANRPRFINFAITNFLSQSYPNTEMVIVDDGLRPYHTLVPTTPKIKYLYTKPLRTIGMKRNFACENSSGEFIVHWDDDDTYAYDWISKSIEQLLSTGAEITGLKNIRLYSSFSNKNFLYEDKTSTNSWLCGATLTYRKSLWSKYHFRDLQIGEDSDFLMNSGGEISALDYTNGYIATLHEFNTSIKFIRTEAYKNVNYNENRH